MLCHATAPSGCCRAGASYNHHVPPARAAVKASRTACPALQCGSSRRVIPSTLWLCLELIPLQLLIQGSALAYDDSATYNNGAQSEFLQALVGFLYLILVAYFFYRVFTGRASRFMSGRVGAKEDAKPVEEDPYLAEPVAVSPLKAFFSASQALAIAAVLYFFATTLDTAMSTANLPDQYTVRSIAVTLRTIVTGLAYLATFIFGANGLGLAALTLKLAIYGDEEAIPAEKKSKIPDNLPKVSLTSHPEDVMRALDKVSDLSRYKRDKTEA